MIKAQNEIDRLYNKYVNTVYRVCFTYMRGSKMDIEDAVQDTFIKLINTKKSFNDDDHIKAWLIVTASNICKNMLKRKYRTDILYEESIENSFDYLKEDEILMNVLILPKNERISIYLFYYEGYSAKEIGDMINKKQSTVWSYLHKGRDILKGMLKEYSR